MTAPRATPAVLIRRLRTIAVWFENDAAHCPAAFEQAQQLARAETCRQAASRLEELTKERD